MLTLLSGSGLAMANAWPTQDPHDHEAAQSAPQADKPSTPGRGMMGGGRMAMPAMMSRDQMIAKMKADDTRVAAALARMNEAKGDAKVAAMADLLNILVDSRQTLHQMVAACPMGGMADVPAK
jgi:hypothetical protein